MARYLEGLSTNFLRDRISLPTSPPPSYEDDSADARTGQPSLGNRSRAPSITREGEDSAFQERIMLTWSGGDEIHGAEPAVHALVDPRSSLTIPTASVTRQSSHSSLNTARYLTGHRTQTNITYTFSPIGNNAMLLVPPADAQETRPQYYIAVSMNCFQPLSHITTIYRGASEHGGVVAEFEMGPVDTVNRLQIGARVKYISTLLTKHGSRSSGYWSYTLPRELEIIQKIKWDYSHRPCACTLMNEDKTLLAKFTPHMEKTPTKLHSQLEMTPEGQRLFDDVLTSLLIIERARLMPVKDVFMSRVLG